MNIERDIIDFHNNEYDGDYTKFTVVDRGDWIDDGKWQSCETVYGYEDRFFMVKENRSGSYWSDYDYDEPTITEVTPIQVTKTEWIVKS